MPNKDT